MKNTILGMICAFTIILSTVICLSLYGSQTRKNELENDLPDIVKQTLQEYYIPEKFRTAEESYPLPEEIEKEICDELELRQSLPCSLKVTVKACDFEKGILSVAVDECYESATGREKTLHLEKTAIVA